MKKPAAPVTPPMTLDALGRILEGLEQQLRPGTTTYVQQSLMDLASHYRATSKYDAQAVALSREIDGLAARLRPSTVTFTAEQMRLLAARCLEQATPQGAESPASLEA